MGKSKKVNFSGNDQEKHEYSAEIKFWNNPYLMKMLIPFLDSQFMVSLAKAHPLVLQVLQCKSSVWNKLVRMAKLTKEKEKLLKQVDQMEQTISDLQVGKHFNPCP